LRLVDEVFGDLSEIDRSLSPVHYGFDSIQVVQFINRLNERLGKSVKVAQAMGAKTSANFSTCWHGKHLARIRLRLKRRKRGGVPAVPQPYQSRRFVVHPETFPNPRAQRPADFPAQSQQIPLPAFGPACGAGRRRCCRFRYKKDASVKTSSDGRQCRRQPCDRASALPKTNRRHRFCADCCGSRSI
jgi:hypothetical protein